MNENQATVMFGAMSNNTRLGILRLLVERGTDGVTAGEIGTRVDASSSRASFHLSALENAGLCTSERRSRHIIYRANLQNLCGLVTFLLNDCCGRNPQILACCLPDRDDG